MNPKIIGSKLHYVCKIRKDHFGSIVMDQCDSDVEHLVHAKANPGDDRARCRELIEEHFEKFLGKEGLLVIDISLDQNYKVEHEKEEWPDY